MIHQAGVEHVPALVELMRDFHAEAGYPLPEGAAARAFETLVRDPRLGRVWILEADGEPAGYLVLTIGFSMEFGGLRAFVDDFFVRPGFRGRGLGTAALDAVRGAAAEMGVRALLVEVGPLNDPARRVYGRAGFADSGRMLMSQALAAPLHEQ